MTAERDPEGRVGRRVLVVEDDYFLATEMAEAVRRAGGTVIGPVPDVADATAILAGAQVDAAVLDVHLGEETSFPVAAALRERNVPMVFVTGYERWFLPSDLAGAPVHRKPVDADAVVLSLFEAGTP